MRLGIEVKREHGDEPQWNRESRQETELAWDAGADAYIEAMASFMFARTFTHEGIIDAMRSYIEQYDDEELEDWGREAEVDDKIAPIQGVNTRL